MKTRFVPLEKQSKKAQKEYHARQRSEMGFNTGIRTMKTDKSPTRAMKKVLDRKEILSYN